jgi:hypothetical protein
LCFFFSSFPPFVFLWAKRPKRLCQFHRNSKQKNQEQYLAEREKKINPHKKYKYRGTHTKKKTITANHHAFVTLLAFARRINYGRSFGSGVLFPRPISSIYPTTSWHRRRCREFPAAADWCQRRRRTRSCGQ